MTDKKSDWAQGYEAGKEETQNKMIEQGFHERIRNALCEAVGEYRTYITTLNEEHSFVDTNDYIALGMLMRAEQIFFSLRQKEQDRKNTELKTVALQASPKKNEDKVKKNLNVKIRYSVNLDKWPWIVSANGKDLKSFAHKKSAEEFAQEIEHTNKVD